LTFSFVARLYHYYTSWHRLSIAPVYDFVDCFCDYLYNDWVTILPVVPA
jgi:hypothetical protein